MIRHHLPQVPWFAAIALALAGCATTPRPTVDVAPDVAVADPPPASTTDAAYAFGREFLGDVVSDYREFFTPLHLCELGVGLAVAAPLAETRADRHIRNWYQNSVRSPETDNLATVAKDTGEFTYTLPVFAAAAAVGAMTDDTLAGELSYDWGMRSLRAMAVGAPMLGLLQVGLGASRPQADDSRWHPFHESHGASGHAFCGAVPFLTAAAMSDEVWLQAPLFVASFAAGWSRINDDAHYTSQVLLGWLIGYLAVDAVTATEAHRSFHIVPTWSNGGPGVAACLEF